MVLQYLWLSAHAGYLGNETADQLAKEAADLAVLGPEPIVPVFLSTVRLSVQKLADERHTVLWNARNDCRQTKQLTTYRVTH